MKNLLLLCVFFLGMSPLLGAQEVDTPETSTTQDLRSNELRLNALLFILGIAEKIHEKMVHREL